MRNKAIILIIGLIGVCLLVRGMGHFQPSTLAGAIIFFVALAVSFIRGTDALYIIIFAMLFSPEIGTSVSTGRVTGEGGGAISLRLEDIILIAVGCGWLLRTAYQKRHFGIVNTPVNPAIALYITVSIIATMLGVIVGTVQLRSGVFHNLKFFEYFFLFFMILAHVRRKEVITKMLAAMLIVFFLALIYGYTQIELTGIKRVSAPFDLDEPNTFGGYIVLLMCLTLGIILHDRRIRIRIPLIGLLIFAFPPLLFTLSRASYMALIAGWLAFMAVSRQRIAVGIIAIGIIAALIIGVPLLPDKVQQRISGTFQVQPEYHVKIGGIDLDSSASARIVSYQAAIETWLKSPFLGHGVTGTHFIDSQYFRLLAETGVIGLTAFLFMMRRLQKEIWKVHKQCQNDFLKGASLGFFCGMIAILVHAISANSFIIIRIAEPFWLLAGLIILIPRVGETDEEMAPDAIQPLANKP